MRDTTKSYPTIAQGFGLVGLLTLLMITQLPILTLSGKVLNDQLAKLIYYVIITATSLFIACVYKKVTEGKSPSFNLHISNWQILPFAIIGVLAITNGISMPIMDQIPMPELIKKLVSKMSMNVNVFTFFTIVIAAPLLEEALFRGVILDGFLKKYSPQRSIVISSVLFGIVHLNPWQFINAFLLGLFMGWVYYKTRSLLPTILMHAANNLFGFIGMKMSDSSDYNKTLYDYYGGWANYIIATVGAILILYLCIIFLKNIFAKEEMKMKTALDDHSDPEV
ncbi:MAG: type II CAAX endopeptidase family protein [Bacteroidales bacterium]|nr:type II CAAX endopeptidase family protein [Bacteroidales bacterium]MDD4822726.1 type II CAAX endopeptidase family protein [Bacteroidales bacterium]